jgi:hypothetical protein
VLLKLLITTLNRDFSTNFDAESMLAGTWANQAESTNGGDEEMENVTNDNNKHLVIIGASNMKRLVLLFLASEYTVTDLTVPSWLATPDNVTALLEKLESLSLSPGYTLVMELFGNSTYRFEQFDGTMALPFKYGNGYHMEGRIGVCDDESFLRLLHSLEPLINHGKPSIKIFVPPLPRYIFSGCCSLKSHSTNVGETDHSEKLLGNTVKFRNILKTALLNRGIDDFFVLDGVGSLIGIPPGENRGPVKTPPMDAANYTNQHSFGPGPILSERGSRVHGGNRGSHFPRARGRGGHGVRGGGGGGERGGSHGGNEPT